jgi:luciferase family oxidoreductase group 1
MRGRVPLRLSALDVSPIPSGSSAGEALGHTIDLARHCEGLGLTRYWLAEHHNAGGLACSTPEIMIGPVAAATRRIRVGAGGIMLPNHTPLKVAESFRVLQALFPGRIDLGLGRAAGTDPRTAHALRGGKGARSSDDFPEMLSAVLGFLAERTEPRPPFSAEIAAVPIGVPSPDVWILGSSEAGGALAAERGLPFAYGHHLSPDDAVRALRAYRAAFTPSRAHATPQAILAVSVVCAATDDEAEALASSLDLSMIRFGQGVRDLPLPSVEEAAGYRYDADEEVLRRLHRTRHIVGGVDRVRATLEALATGAQVDEVMIMTNVHDQAARRRSYDLVVDAVRGGG